MDCERDNAGPKLFRSPGYGQISAARHIPDRSRPHRAPTSRLPPQDEPDPRPLPEARIVAAAVADIFDALIASLQASALPQLWALQLGKAFRERDERPAKGRDRGFARVP
jgi:hypothetical protein